MATPPPPSDAEASRKPRKGGAIKRLLVLILVAVICAGGGFGAGWFMFANTGSAMSDALRLIDRSAASDDAPAEPGMPRQPRPIPEAESFVTSYYTFEEPLTTNPAGSRRFVQLGVSLSTQYDAQVMAHVETHKVAIRSDMLAVLGGFSEEAMAGTEGREALADALRDAINARLEALEGFGGIEGVYFPSFVVQ
jgi:flagellar protein FliL